MEILKESELLERLDFVSPLNPEPEKPVSMWCIPFEYGSLPKGTRISKSLARTIIAELRAAVIADDNRILLRALKEEKERSNTFSQQAANAEEKFRMLEWDVRQKEAERKKKARSKR